MEAPIEDTKILYGPLPNTPIVVVNELELRFACTTRITMSGLDVYILQAASKYIRNMVMKQCHNSKIIIELIDFFGDTTEFYEWFICAKKFVRNYAMDKIHKNHFETVTKANMHMDGLDDTKSLAEQIIETDDIFLWQAVRCSRSGIDQTEFKRFEHKAVEETNMLASGITNSGFYDT